MNNSSDKENTDSQGLLNQVVLEFIREQKNKRRWRWITRGIFILLILLLIFNAPDLNEENKTGNTKSHVGLIDVKGTIFDTEISADNFAKSLDTAYKNTGMKALVVRINSPGGSPVQADYMYNLLQHYKMSHPKVPIYAVCVDICASAAYYVAAGADKIYANPASMVGSIGVLYNGFGFVDAMQKLGISRRLQTAGVNKAFLDPFSPTTPEQEHLLQVMLNEVHQQFISKVKKGRGSRLKIDKDTFSGLFWTGTQAKTRGLIDGFASTGEVAMNIVKINKLIDYTHKKTFFDRVSKSIGTAMANQLPEALGLKQGVLEKI